MAKTDSSGNRGILGLFKDTDDAVSAADKLNEEGFHDLKSQRELQAGGRCLDFVVAGVIVGINSCTGHNKRNDPMAVGFSLDRGWMIW